MTRLPMGPIRDWPIRDCPETSALFRGAMEEAAAVGRAMGIPLPEDCVDQHGHSCRVWTRPCAAPCHRICSRVVVWSSRP
jgi:hypothetical protein